MKRVYAHRAYIKRKYKNYEMRIYQKFLMLPQVQQIEVYLKLRQLLNLV